MASKTLGGSYSRVTQRLHWLMLGLSAVASLALFFIDSLLYKALLALILLAYAAFLARHSHLAALLLPFPVAQPRPDHAKIREWTASTSTQGQSDPQAASQSITGKKQPFEVGNREEGSWASADRSVLHESFSSFRGQSTSYLNDSHLSASRRKVPQSRGIDLSSLFSERSETKSLGKSSGVSERGLQVLDRKAIARKRLLAYRSQGERGYEQQLGEARKSSKYVQSRYPVILNFIHALITPLLNEHNANSAKINELSQEFLDITIDEKASSPQSVLAPQNAKKTQGQTLRISSQGLLQRFLQAYVRKQPLELTKLPLRGGKKWNDFEKKINELVRSRIRIAESLGVPTEDLYSQVRKPVPAFLAQYREYVGMLEGYVGADLTKKGYQASIDELSEQSMLREFKNRIYVLYLYVRHLNVLLRGSVRVCLRDFMGFRPTGEGDVEIVPKYSFDAYVPYYNLLVKEGLGKKCYPCEYGPANYLSLLYFLLLALSKRNELRDRPEVVRIINEAL